jgi:putative ABC transport system permease protein
MNRAFKQAIKALRGNLVRTILTTLGIMIGIAMVILVLAAGEGFRSFITSQLEAYGTNTIFIETRVPATTKMRAQGQSNEFSVSLSVVTTLKNRDVADIKRVPNVKNAYGSVFGLKAANYKDVTKNASIWGTDPARFEIDTGKLTSGRFFTDQDNLAAAQVALLGSQLAADLFHDEDPIGKIIRVGDYNFVVIGVFEKRGSAGSINPDQQIFVPLVTAQKKLIGIDYLTIVIVQVKDQNMAEATAEDIRWVLRANHSITDPAKEDFIVQTQAQGLAQVDKILSAINFLLIAIAAISLIVGGVGIMNIMYVVVTERTAEIGLKKALGATGRDILQEFLLEAVMVTLIGGVIGIIFGSLGAYGLALIAHALSFAWTFSIPLVGTVSSILVSGSIGLLFGVLPAYRASKLDPIEALRYE